MAPFSRMHKVCKKKKLVRSTRYLLDEAYLPVCGDHSYLLIREIFTNVGLDMNMTLGNPSSIYISVYCISLYVCVPAMWYSLILVLQSSIPFARKSFDQSATKVLLDLF